MKSETLIALGTVVTAMATIAIACFSWQMRAVAKRSDAENRAFRSQLSDLYQAIVIATIVAGTSPPKRMIDGFKELYTGSTPIFPDVD